MPAPMNKSKTTARRFMVKLPEGRRLSFLALAFFVTGLVQAGALDMSANQDPFLRIITEALDVYAIDVAHNLNSRDVVKQRLERVRLGRFPDLPLNRLPDSDEIRNWETEYQSSNIGGIAILGPADNQTPEDASRFMQMWLDAPSEDRLFVTFHVEDQQAAARVQQVVDAYGFNTLFFFASKLPANAGNYYATAAQRLGLDSSGARRYRSEVTEIAYLGESVRRNSESLFREESNRDDSSLARLEPSVFLKETLGDEFNQSTIREIVVPGGVALGETASLAIDAVALIYSDSHLSLTDSGGISWALPSMEPKSLKALFDFVQRSEAINSDAIVDIDADGRVRISSALRDTDIGFQIMHADTKPFEFVTNLSVTKSVIIDVRVAWFPSENETLLQFETSYEVRFLSADNMRIAQTRAALQYGYQSATASSTFGESWGRESRRLDDNIDYAGLGNSVAEVANYAGWVGLFRKIEGDQIPFLHGRYEFMKIDKTGRNTPIRY